MTVFIEDHLGELYGSGTGIIDGAEKSYESHEHQLWKIV